MRVPTITVDRNGTAVVINRSDFRLGVDRPWGEAAPASAPAADDESKRLALIEHLSAKGLRIHPRTGLAKLQAMAEAEG